MFFKKGIVLELQKECLDSHTSVADILRKAKVIAVKLDLKELVDWIDKELNGYVDDSLLDLPEYRKGRGSPKFFNPYRGYCPIIVGEGQYGDIISTVFLAQGVSALEDLAKDKKSDTLIYQYPPALQSSLQEQMEFAMECSLHFSRNQIRATLDYVRNRVLDWALELEKRGILGEDLSFDDSEKKEAQAVTNHIYGSNIGVLGSVGRDASVSNLSVNESQPDFDATLKLVSQIRETLHTREHWGVDRVCQFSFRA